MPTYTDKKGYKRHSNLVHREKAYEQIYKKNRDRYPLPFSEYVVHHKDGNKQNNEIDNLDILTPDEHEGFHNESYSYTSYGEDIDFLTKVQRLSFALLIPVTFVNFIIYAIIQIINSKGNFIINNFVIPILLLAVLIISTILRIINWIRWRR